MSASTKLSNAVKALCYLAEVFPDYSTSSEISLSIGLNASKLRWILSMLSKNEIVDSAQGVKGGFLLKKKPEEINLQEIYCAVEDRKAFHLDVGKLNGQEVDKTLKTNNFFLSLFSDIQVDIENKMKRIKLIDVIRYVEGDEKPLAVEKIGKLESDYKYLHNFLK